MARSTNQALGGLSKTVQSLRAGTNKTTETILELLKALELTAKTAGKVTTGLASFDTLNRLAKPASVSAKEMEELTSAMKSVYAQSLKPLSVKSFDNMSSDIAGVAGGLQNVLDKKREADRELWASMEPWERLKAVLGDITENSQLAESAQKYFGTALKVLSGDMESTDSLMQKLGGSIYDLSGSFQVASEASAGAALRTNQQWSGSGSYFENAVVTPVRNAFSSLWKQVGDASQGAWDATREVFSDAGGFFESVFSTAWSGVQKVFSKNGEVFVGIKDGVLTGFKSAVNALIDGINDTVAVPFGSINDAIKQLKSYKVGNSTPFSTLKWTSHMPKIPHLAQGAVLPANQPFLAVVGDQRHGTNVEAPLQTITEALGIALEDMQGRSDAQGRAVVELLGRILEAVRGIGLTDSSVGRAVERYYQKQAVMYGVG